MIDFAALAAPFPAEETSWRLGSVNKDRLQGKALAYLDARNVMDRLDDVCGPDGWQCRYSHVGDITVCDIGIWCGEEGTWIWKADGAGQSDIEAEKGALSDAFKRAAVRWGVGRYLYGLDSPWVAVEETYPNSKKYRIQKGEYAKLDGLLRRAIAGIAAASTPPKPPAIDNVDPADRGLIKDGETRSTYDISKRKAAENFASAALAAFEGLNGSTINEWYREPISPKGRSTNRDALDRMRETFPDLADKVDAAAEEVRLRGGARLQ